MDYMKSFGIQTGEGKHQEEAFYGLILVYNLIFDRMAEYLSTWGLTPAQFNILLVVGKNGNDQGIAQVDISKKLVVTASNTTRLLEKMENERLIIRQSKDEDRRFKMVHITPKGTALLDKVWPEYLHKIQQIVSVLEEDEQKKAATLFLRWLKLLGIE